MLVLVLACGCLSTRAPSSKAIEFSGFLSDYSKLEKRRKSFGVFSYVKPGLSLEGYDSLLVEKPKILVSEKSRAELDESDLEAILKHARNMAAEHILPYIQIAENSGPGVLQLRWAITELKPASKLNIVSGLVPQIRVASLVLSKGTDTHLFVGKVSVEGEILDSQTGEILIAGVDARVGSNAVQNVGSKWADVEDAFELWARSFTENLRAFGFPINGYSLSCLFDK